MGKNIISEMRKRVSKGFDKVFNHTTTNRNVARALPPAGPATKPNTTRETSRSLPQPSSSPKLLTTIDAAVDDRDSRESDIEILSPTKTITEENGKRIEREDIFQGDRDRSLPRIERSSTFPTGFGGEQQSQGIQSAPIEEEGSFTITFPLNTPFPRRKSTRSLISHNDISTPIFPRTITCQLVITFNEDEEKKQALKIDDFIWYEAENYKSIQGAIHEIKKQFLERGLTKTEHIIYLRYASCFVKGNKNQCQHRHDDRLLIDNEEVLPDAAVQAICGFIHDYPFEQFVLEVHCDYSSIDKHFTLEGGLESWPPEKGAFHTAIQEEYMDKMGIGRPTIKDQEYLSWADQQVLVTPANARRVIDEDGRAPPRLTPAEQVTLQHEVQTRPANTLQAVCVYGSIPMKFLHHLLYEEPHATKKFTDKLETLHLENPNTCQDELCRKYYKRFVENIYKFYPETISSDSEHSTKDNKAIIPVRYKNRQTPLGSGAFSEVHEVDIDPHHQLLSPDVKRTYALKTFWAKQKYKDGFDREIKMLFQLAEFLPHPHILTHITSWEQDKVYYILYEKAHRNLRDHMRTYAGTPMTSEKILWFFNQIRGLSDAVRRVHFFHEPKVNRLSGEVNSKKTGVVGRHHDIKPENILAFGFPEELPILKLSDFGSGKFSSVRAYSESGQGATEIRGTRTYVGPESDRRMNEPMTRPFDMWALGCVFLELLLWLLDIDKPDGVKDFADMRMSLKYNSSPDSDYFWQCSQTGIFSLNGAVSHSLGRLRRDCRDMQPFLDLIDLISQLLEIRPAKRPEALKLFNGLDVICVKASAELNRHPDRYLKTYQRNRNPDKSNNLDIPGPEANLAPLQRLDEDVSTTGESRVASAVNLRRLDDAATASEPPVSGVNRASTLRAGDQFATQRPRPGSTLTNGDTNEDDDDDDSIYMGGTAQPRPGLTELITDSVRSLARDE